MEYYKSIAHYAEEKGIDWRTAKRLLTNKQIVELEFKRQKVILDMNDIIRFLLLNIGQHPLKQNKQ